MDFTNPIDDQLEDEKDEFEKDESIFHPDQVPRLSEDGARPAAPPNDIPGAQRIPIDDPLTDDDLDPDEVYNEGIGQASGATTTFYDSDAVERVDDENQDATGGRAR